jgi:hypothetical protein
MHLCWHLLNYIRSIGAHHLLGKRVNGISEVIDEFLLGAMLDDGNPLIALEEGHQISSLLLNLLLLDGLEEALAELADYLRGIASGLVWIIGGPIHEVKVVLSIKTSSAFRQQLPITEVCRKVRQNSSILAFRKVIYT